MTLRRDAQATAEAMCQALYTGTIFLLPASELSLQLVRDVTARIPRAAAVLSRRPAPPGRQGLF